MDLGKPISGLPKPSSPFPERGTSEPLDLADPDEVAEPACGSEPLVVADRGRVDEPTPPSIDIPLPGFWKFAHAWLLFAFFAFPAIIAGSRHPSDLGVLLPIGAVYLGLVWRITRSSISGSAQSL